jgi:hypothetical protein
MDCDTDGVPTATFVDLEARDARTLVMINVSPDF